MLYCITSAQYRSSFLQTLTCGRLRGMPRGRHVNQSSWSTIAVTRGRTSIASPCRRRSSPGVGVKRLHSMSSKIGSSKSPMRLKTRVATGREGLHNLNQISANTSNGSMMIYQKSHARFPNRYSLPGNQIETRT